MDKNININILLVDDSAADTLITSKVIERDTPKGVTVHISTASRLSDAETTLCTENYDCVLLDLYLPDGRGPDNIQKLHQLSPHTPIIVLSGSDQIRSQEEALQHGACAFIIKQPYKQADNILAVVMHSLEQIENQAGKTVQ